MRRLILFSAAFGLAALAPLLGAASAEREVAALEAAEVIELQDSCGNRRCEPPEDCRSCPQDCGDCCGNNRCEPPEDCRSCPRDCGDCCGNGRCEPPEDERSCPRDC